MSHFSTIQTQIVAKEYLLKALNDLHLKWQEGNIEINGYQGNKTRVEICVETNNAGFDIGFRKNAKNYELIADWWGIKDINQEEFVQNLTQRYAYHAVKDQLEQQDFTFVEEEIKDDKTIHLTVRRMY